MEYLCVCWSEYSFIEYFKLFCHETGLKIVCFKSISGQNELETKYNCDIFAL